MKQKLQIIGAVMTVLGFSIVVMVELLNDRK